METCIRPDETLALRQLRLLLVEDDPGDAGLIERQFSKSGYTIDSRRVDSPSEMMAALNERVWDGIICDYRLPQFTALDALEIWRNSGLDTPVLVVSGALGEEHAVEIMRAGAHDYIHKSRLERVPPALERARREVNLGRARRMAEDRERRATARLTAILESMVEGYIVMDSTWVFVAVNRKAEHMLSRRRDDLLGRSIWTSCMELAGSLMRVEFERAVRQQKSAEFQMPLPETALWLRVHAYPSGDGVTAFLQDITPQVLASEELRKSLAAKEALLREVHHRVKNNLQMVCSLMRLQVNDVGDERLRGLFQRSEARILCLAAIHDRLCQSSDPAKIDLAEHVRTIANQVFASAVDGNVELALDVAPVGATMDIAIPCGLILNELLANSLMHAFSGERKGRIAVTLVTSNKEISLIVEDDGVGFGHATIARPSTGLGLRLVHTLARQLNGTARFEQAHGTRCEVRFPSSSGA